MALSPGCGAVRALANRQMHGAPTDRFTADTRSVPQEETCNTKIQTFAKHEAAEAEASLWWNDLRERSLGTCHIREWGYLWTSVMLRRVKPEGSLYRFRSINRWEGLINRQASPDDPEGPDYEHQTYDFFHLQDSPWSILRRPTEKNDYGIGRVATLEEDIEYPRGRQSKRMVEENRLRLDADQKGMSLQPAGKTDYLKQAMLGTISMFGDGTKRG
jgi:hypothetical protein